MKLKKIKGFDIANNFMFILLVIISLFPIYLIFANAFSSEADITKYGYAIFPLHFSFQAIKYVLREPSQILWSLWSSIFHAVGASFISVLIQTMLGYALTRPEFALKKVYTILLVITMFFGAGLIPQYIVRTQVYHLENTWLVYLIPGVSGFSVFVFRSFFNQVPKSLIECAELEGATHMQILIKISLPLSITFVATQFFLSFVGLWKDFGTTLYYIQDPHMYTLEFYIQQILKDATIMKAALLNMGIAASDIPVETMKFATVLFTVIPMVIIFPFFQKYFSKGMMVGAVKG